MEKIIRLGILGCARVNQMAIFSVIDEVPEVKVQGIASRGAERAREAATAHGIPDWYPDYESLLAAPNIDAIYIPLPNGLHCEYSLKAIEAGKPVLCEKPIANNAQEAQLMSDRARELGVPIVEAFHYRYHPMMTRLSELLASGVIGKLIHINSIFNVTSERFDPEDIRCKYSLGGGSTLDPGSYCINLIRMIAGMEPKVETATPRLHSPDIDIAMTAEMSFPDGCTARMETALSADVDGFKMEAEIVGEQGKIYVHNPFLPHWGSRIDIEVNGQTTSEEFTTPPTYLYQLRAFRDFLLNGAPILTTVEDGQKNMRVLDDIYKAAGMRIRGL